MRARRPALSTSSLAFCSSSARPSNSWPALCFQSLPTIKLCNSFLLITIQNAGGGWVPAFALHSSLQIRPFVFNNFQDAPPATLYFSWFCIVARGWVPRSVHHNLLHESRVTPFVLLRALPRSATIAPLLGPCIRAKYWETKLLPPVSKMESGKSRPASSTQGPAGGRS